MVKKIWIDYGKYVLNFAGKYNIDFVTFHIGYIFDNGCRKDRGFYYKDVCEGLNLLQVESERTGVEIHIENLPDYTRFSPISFLGDCIQDFNGIFNSVTGIKLCYDFGHGNLDRYGIEILRYYYQKLGSVHAHSNDQVLDQHEELMKGKGIDWEYEIIWLDNHHFEGPFILESAVDKQIESLKQFIDMRRRIYGVEF